ncbi:MAG: LamG domain-containing protein, partial [Candidatus Paceibacterota bacterium]
ELTSSMESAKYKLGGANDKTSKDGGLYTGLYELGTNLTLLPLDYGDTSLVGYWKFDEGTGTIAYDASGKGKNGTFSSSAPSWTTGKIGNGALSFNGTSNYVNLTNLAVNTASGANNTVSFWMKWDGTGSTAMPFSFSSLYDLMINGSKFGFNTSCSDSFGIPFSSAQYANVWVYITAIFNNNNVSQSQIFLNGIQQVLSQSNTPCNKAATANSLVGAWVGPSYHFPGLIDDVRIYNRALSVTEILALYSATNK